MSPRIVRSTNHPRPKGRVLHPHRVAVRREHADLLVRDYFEKLDSPRALSCWMLYKYGEHRQLVFASVKPQDYDDWALFRSDYAAVKFLSKCVGLKTDIDLKGAALASAEEAERLCQTTNASLKAISTGHASDLYGPEIFRAIQIVADILGPVPESFPDVGWSPGRTSSAWGPNVTGYQKYQSRPDVTVRSRSKAWQLLVDSPWWGASILQCDAPVSVLPSTFTYSRGNTLLTVPKSAKTDRVICYEPHMNIRLQLNVGAVIRSRLRKHGVNLDDQSINRRRAKFASKTGRLATIDLSMASDTVATELVYQLLPIDWACLLDDLRSPYTLWPDGSWRKNEKFSSMGNGYTFELESLIFFALCKAVSENVSVYGDDIIVDTDSFYRVSRLLTACGFRLNASKSFSTGLFRESCGGDYFGGVDVTPVYLRSLPKTVEDVVKLHNQVRRFASATEYRDRSWAAMLGKWRTIHRGHLGPQGFGDGHYHVNWDEGSFPRAKFWIDGWYYISRIVYMPNCEGDLLGAPALSTALGPNRPLSLLHSALKRLVRYRDKRCLVSGNWPDVPWV